MEAQLMNFNETKRYLNVSRATLYRYAAEGKLPAYKAVGRWKFKKEDIDAWLNMQSNSMKMDPIQAIH